ncbi:hypothetical protein E2I00_014529, partial [Balaenoptera physalus]
AALFSMAKRPLLLLLAMGVLAGELWTETQAAPYRVKLCGREFIRAVIFTCGGSRWRRSDILAYEAMGEAGEVLCADRAGRAPQGLCGAAAMSWLASPATVASGGAARVKSAASARRGTGQPGSTRPQLYRRPIPAFARSLPPVCQPLSLRPRLLGVLELWTPGHSNKTWTVAVPTGQSWVTIPREQLTTSDELLVWVAKAGQPLWPPVFVNLETRMKPDAPQLYPDVDFSEDDPLEATVQWAPPVWPPHKVLVCQFYYRRCQEMAWTLLEPEVKSIPLTPVDIQDLELATGYEVSGRCQVEEEEDLWSECVDIREHLWGTRRTGTPASASGHCVQVSYRVWFQIKDQEVNQEETPCCSFSIPTRAEWAGVSAVNATSWEPPTNLSLACLGPGFAPHGVVVSSIPASSDLLVTWQQGSGELQEHVVDWARDGDPLEDLNWVWLPPGNLSAVLPGDFEGGVPYQITVTAVSPWGLAPAPSVWKFREELVPLAGPMLWRLQDAPPGTPAVAWGEVPRHQLRGHLTHYTLCAQSGTRPSVCMNVSGSTRTITLPDLHWGTCELCVHLRHKVLPHWVWEKVPDPANSNFSLPHMKEVPQAQPPGDSPILEVEEIEQVPITEAPQASAPLDSGYEKHFLPTPEELGLLGHTPGSSWSIDVPCDPALAIPKVKVEQEMERNQSSRVIAWIRNAQRNKFFLF